ncbi:MAG: ComF family protein [Dehalococcoidia bacterium]|nr:MAG: ComF family protein [Dehalococcoidia bacterium]
MLYRLDRLGKAVTDSFFPQFCIGCGLEGEVVCPACLAKLPRLSPPFCSRCGLPQTGGQSCRDCAGLDLAIDGIRSPLTFQKLTREAVHQLKYRNMRVMAAPLAAVLHDYLTENPIDTDVFIPVPLHPQRLRERGYNQSLLLAHQLGKLCGIPVRSDILKRHVHTPPQARTASSVERHRNMREAFKSLDGKVKDKRVLLIDDVSTSGATLDACASALKRAGALSVWGLTVAREV